MRRPADFLISLLIMQTRCSIKNIEAILEFTSYGVIVVNEDGLIVSCNKTAEEITQLRAKDVIGKHTVDVLPCMGLHTAVKQGTSRRLSAPPSPRH
jgi:PAS domain S-box-containing protein